jgi:hypothetical protein
MKARRPAWLSAMTPWDWTALAVSVVVAGLLIASIVIGLRSLRLHDDGRPWLRDLPRAAEFAQRRGDAEWDGRPGWGRGRNGQNGRSRPEDGRGFGDEDGASSAAE